MSAEKSQPFRAPAKRRIGECPCALDSVRPVAGIQKKKGKEERIKTNETHSICWSER